MKNKIKKIILIFLISFNSNKTIYDEIITLKYKCSCKKESCLEVHKILKTYNETIFKIWFFSDLIQSIQYALSEEDPEILKILTDLCNVIILISKIDKSTIEEHYEDTLKSINITKSLLENNTIKYYKNINMLLNICLCKFSNNNISIEMIS